MTANLLSMGAVDFGIIVDGAVILVEHLFHALAARWRAHAARAEPAGTPTSASRRGAPRWPGPTLFSLLIIIAAYLPIFSLQRVEGRIFAPMANTVVSALVGALLVSFTLVPVLAALRLPQARSHRESPLLAWAARAYEPALTLRDAATRPLVMVCALGALFAGGRARSRGSARSSCPSSTRARST